MIGFRILILTLLCYKKLILYNQKNKYIYNARWRGHTFHCFASSPSSRGVSIFIKKDFPFELINRSSDGRKILLNIKIIDKIYSLVNLYAPNKVLDRKAFFTTAKSWFKNLLLMKMICLW